MSLISRIIHGVFGESESVIKSAAIKSAEAIVEAELPAATTLATTLLAAKGVTIPEADVQEILATLLKDVEAKVESATGVAAAQ